MRHRLERDRDLRDLAREPLAGAQVERHAGPAPVVHHQLHRGVRLGRRVVRHVLLVEVGLRVLAADEPSEYWERTAIFGTSSGSGAGIACRTLTFSSRTSSAENDTGGSPPAP